ncbi:MAG TPA: rod shape-determining protein MreC [Bryobacteraceae bacterium]|nr:rod shape-determining protein MreC [Bryobacteraceae bacterium]
MDSLLGRYRNITVLLLVLFAQLILLAYQVRTDQDVRLIRIWAVSAVTPVARVLEGARTATVHFFEDYLLFAKASEENRHLRAELGRLKMENQSLRSELGTAERAKLLSAYRERQPSRTVAARIIGTGAGSSSKVVFVDRGSADGVRRGMAVITPDGIVGKVTESFPTASQVLLITDPTFAAGVVSENHRVMGTLKGTGKPDCIVDYLQIEERVDVGEWFYTSGDDRVFPRGIPVGKVVSTGQGKVFKDVVVMPSGPRNGLEEVLIVLEGVHKPIPETSSASEGMYMLPAPLSEQQAASLPEDATTRELVFGTEADRLREHYRKVGEAQGHVYGEGAAGSRPPDFNLKLSEPPAAGSPASGAVAAGPDVNAVAPPKAAKPPAVQPAKTSPAPQRSDSAESPAQRTTPAP